MYYNKITVYNTSDKINHVNTINNTGNNNIITVNNDENKDTSLFSSSSEDGDKTLSIDDIVEALIDEASLIQEDLLDKSPSDINCKNIDTVIDDLLTPQPYTEIDDFLQDHKVPEPDSMSIHSIALTFTTIVPLMVLMIMMGVPIVINLALVGVMGIGIGWHTNRVIYEYEFIENNSHYYNESVIDDILDNKQSDDIFANSQFLDNLYVEYNNIKNNALQFYDIIQDNPSDKVVEEARNSLREQVILFIQHYCETGKAAKKAQQDIETLDNYHDSIQEYSSTTNISIINDSHKAQFG